MRRARHGLAPSYKQPHPRRVCGYVWRSAKTEHRMHERAGKRPIAQSFQNQELQTVSRGGVDGVE